VKDLRNAVNAQDVKIDPSPFSVGEPLAVGYIVLAHLSRGEDLDAYDLWSEERDCRCVGKALRPDRMDDRVIQRRLRREGRLLLRLTHPHIVRAYDLVTDPHPALILETLPGMSLERLLEAGPLPLVNAAHLGLHLCSAFAYLHRQGFVHLDLNPANIVASQQLAKVLDFSLAQPPGKRRGGLGTPGFMAPEQVRGGLLGSATDIWGIGAVLAAAVTPEAPDIGDAHVSDGLIGVTMPTGSCRHMPDAIAPVVEACLDPDPARRPAIPSVAAMLERLV
jgi:serine/threonine protein kinase